MPKKTTRGGTDTNTRDPVSGRRQQTNDTKKDVEMGTRLLLRALRYGWLDSWEPGKPFKELSLKDRVILHCMARMQESLPDGEKPPRGDVLRMCVEMLRSMPPSLVSAAALTAAENELLHHQRNS